MAANSMKDTPCGPAIRDEQPKPNGSGEIAITDCLEVLWKRKILILTATVMSALITIIILRLVPYNYELKYVYDISSWKLDASTYSVLLNNLYSEDNLKSVQIKLQEYGLDLYANQINRRPRDLFKYISLQTSPQLLRNSNPATDSFFNQDILQDKKAASFQITISCHNKSEIQRLASVFRNEIEVGLLLSFIESELMNAIELCRSTIAQIEENRYHSQLQLKMKTDIAAELKAVSNYKATNQNLIIQFNFANSSLDFSTPTNAEFAEYKKVELNELIDFDQARHDFFIGLENLYSNLLAEFRQYGTGTEDFLALLADRIEQTDDVYKDSLQSYLRQTEIKIAAMEPIVKDAPLCVVSKEVVKKTCVASVCGLCFFVLIAFLLEGNRQKSIISK